MFSVEAIMGQSNATDLQSKSDRKTNAYLTVDERGLGNKPLKDRGFRNAKRFRDLCDIKLLCAVSTPPPLLVGGDR
jgi:hypothetical protein